MLDYAKTVPFHNNWPPELQDKIPETPARPKVIVPGNTAPPLLVIPPQARVPLPSAIDKPPDRDSNSVGWEGGPNVIVPCVKTLPIAVIAPQDKAPLPLAIERPPDNDSNSVVVDVSPRVITPAIVASPHNKEPVPDCREIPPSLVAVIFDKLPKIKLPPIFKLDVVLVDVISVWLGEYPEELEYSAFVTVNELKTKSWFSKVAEDII